MTLDEVQLWERFESCRTEANRNSLIEFYLPFMQRLAGATLKRLPRWSGIEINDLVNDAVPGLISAIDRFDRSRGFEFQTFAARRVIGAIRDQQRALDWVPRVERKRLKSDTTASEVRMQSLDNHAKRFTLRLPTAQAAIEIEEFWKSVCIGLSRPERLAVLMYWRIGITMREVGTHIGLSESRVSQMLTSVLRRLRDSQDLPVRIAV